MMRALPLVVGLAPIIGVSAAYWLNAATGTLPVCMPLLDGCTSISATGRYLPGSMPFRAVLLPQAAFLMVLWWACAECLKTTAVTARYRRTVLVSGIVGAAALILYVTFLGTKQPFYEFMRRFGVYFYFLGTAISQILFTVSMPTSKLRTAMTYVIAVPFVLGILNLLQKMIFAAPNHIQNRVEWMAALLMQIWFILLYMMWRRMRLTITVQTSPPPGVS